LGSVIRLFIGSRLPGDFLVSVVFSVKGGSQ